MTTLTKSRFARRSLVLCGVAGGVVIWLMLSLVNLQLVPRKTSGVSSGGIIEREVLLPQRGRIMDANEEILTSNMQSSELIADGYHLNDPKTISWALAYSRPFIPRSGRKPQRIRKRKSLFPASAARFWAKAPAKGRQQGT
ncbi:MAG: hypothetical protein ACLSUW_09620 [Akkermansia sp.]